MAKKKILVVDDEKDILELLEYNLEKEGYEVLKAMTGEETLELVKKESPDLIILDLMLPGLDGLEVCKILKKDTKTASLPIIILTAKGEESDIIVGLELGADDYITKPFSPKVLIARVKTVLRRLEEKLKPKEVIQIEDLTIDTPRHKVTSKGKPIELTKIEFNLFKCLASNPGRVFTRDQLLDSAWGEETFIIDRAVDVHIRRLRKKLKTASKLIVTIRGVGYKFESNED
ncbi:response regulator [candidate division NPL-UPA2 bacterium Unc8]|uniref:Phosphate regulon transcriptional regulatory protein PhoB n=2 Tax=Bacteria TaxID=2 RepID=A0A9E2BJ55_PSYF1|nr:Phosphate regulon transcriptional regulatory protein PhoB [Candidatus Psychracetigena formicireducens]MBT9147960.1 Phosphate regulon transcriptional regulatory protein PhoB [Bacillota bacterium]RIH99707.1 MAG: response regulator [candidate division NPL-UPA2 bacterium Unc8]